VQRSRWKNEIVDIVNTVGISEHLFSNKKECKSMYIVTIMRDDLKIHFTHEFSPMNMSNKKDYAFNSNDLLPIIRLLSKVWQHLKKN
jgi:hypothetical protein